MTYSKSYGMGRIAYQEGIAERHNPFLNNPDRQEWRRGYREADQEAFDDFVDERSWIKRLFERLADRFSR